MRTLPSCSVQGIWVQLQSVSEDTQDRSDLLREEWRDARRDNGGENEDEELIKTL